jgi:hypothetical protein
MKRTIGVLGAVVGLGALQQAAAAPARALETAAERSGYRITGRYDEVERLCRAYAATWPDAVRCAEFGRTPEGRPMLALTVSRSGALTPEDARERGVPVALVQGGIHAGEIDGKDAGFLAARELLSGKGGGSSLDAFVLVFVPVFNVDGHERFGRWNRPNQSGPEQMGWRTTGQNLNLNRDYCKAEAPEMQAMLRLLDAWDPVLYVDLHVTDGAQFQHDVSNQVEPVRAGDAGLHAMGRALNKELNVSLARQGSLPLDFYPSFRVEDDPASGFAAAASTPRFSTGYWAVRNRFAVLVETHSWKDYPTRVRVTRNVIVTLAEMMARSGAAWRAAAREADERARRLGGSSVPISYKTDPTAATIEFRGYAYTREPSAISGALVTRYDATKPQIWRVPLYGGVTVEESVVAPRGGYVVPAAHAAWMAEKLAMHGVEFDRIDRPMDSVQVETFRATSVALSAQSFEGRTSAKLEGQWREERADLRPGSLFVPIAQAKARLVIALLEPRSADSYVAWGFFNNAFERKEYMEPYVAEPAAREMLEGDPQLAAEFARRLAQDPGFAASPQARLDFFHQRHPAWDRAHNLYPVMRVSTTRWIAR